MTAGYGEGHNSAANGLARALKASAEVKVEDSCAKGDPGLNEFLRQCYRMVTTYAPTLWSWYYRAIERRDFTKETFEFMRKPELAMAAEVKAFQPDAVVSTYPLYPYFLERLRKRGFWKGKVFTVVTDSIEINNAWLQAPTDYWLVTDNFTREEMLKYGLAPERVIETGFPIAPLFEELPHLSASVSADPFRVLYFATARKPQICGVGKPVLECPGTTLTVVLGRNFRRLYREAKKLQRDFPGRVKILGWTKKVPELMSQHHIAIGKAGGATVHECLAATTPLLIHHLVPGQEEGNLELFRRIGGGELADSPAKLRQMIEKLKKDDAAEWRRWKGNLAKWSRPHSASLTASVILEKLAAENVQSRVD